MSAKVANKRKSFFLSFSRAEKSYKKKFTLSCIGEICMSFMMNELAVGENEENENHLRVAL
jgi:hypothetical protein